MLLRQRYVDSISEACVYDIAIMSSNNLRQLVRVVPVHEVSLDDHAYHFVAGDKQGTDGVSIPV